MAYANYEWTDKDGDTLRMTLHEDGDVIIGITDQFGGVGPLHVVGIDELRFGIEKMREQLRLRLDGDEGLYDPEVYETRVPRGGFDG